MELTKVLVTYATREELVRIDWEDVQTAYLLTGVGKMKSAYYLSDAIDKMQPDCVINIGTAGTVRHNVGDIFVCRSFIDRDMQKLKDFGVSFRVDVPLYEKMLPACFYTHAGQCNTGDAFLMADEPFDGDVCDMESYAQAFVCADKKVPFVAVKYVTDVIGRNSVAIWQDKLAEAQKALYAFVNGKEEE
jgi:adenosylhomocysteine nucleosidase